MEQDLETYSIRAQPSAVNRVQLVMCFDVKIFTADRPAGCTGLFEWPALSGLAVKQLRVLCA